MDPFQGIIIDVLSNGQILDLYDDPDVATARNARTRQHYVEAIDGASFSVRVLLTTEFDLYDINPTDAIEVVVILGGQKCSTTQHLPRQQLESMLLRGKPGEFSFTGLTYFCPRAGQWIRSDYAFGRLETSIPHIVFELLNQS